MRPANVFLIMELSNSRGKLSGDFLYSPVIKKYQNPLTLKKDKVIILSLTVDGRKKSLYPLYLLGCSDFCRCCGL